MVEVDKVTENVYKFSGSMLIENCYLLLKEKTMIDTGEPRVRKGLKEEISRFIDPYDIEIVILTHVHFDHAGNVSLFPNAKFYASKREIEDFEKHPSKCVFDAIAPEVTKDLNKLGLLPIEELALEGVEVIPTPGHTAGSICIFYKKEVLFSGDALFSDGVTGRWDLPNSVPDEINASAEKLKQLNYKILCPGHDY